MTIPKAPGVARVAFMGTPDFAVPCLEALASHPRAQVVLVVCQPDKVHGRHKDPQPPPVKSAALRLGIPVLQPTRLKSGEFPESFRGFELDLAVVTAYGRILPQALLDTPRLGCVNVHASLLPRWRGAAPIQWSIAHGDPGTGVSLMQMDAGLDTGDVLSTVETSIEASDTGSTLHDRLSVLGADLLSESLPGILDGALQRRPQDPSSATLAPMLSRSDGALDVARPAAELERRLRAFDPWPGAFVMLGDQVLKLFHPATVVGSAAEPGTLLADGDGVILACQGSGLRVTAVQLEGRRRMSAGEFLRGFKLPSL